MRKFQFIHRLTKKALLIPKEALIRTGIQNRVVLALGEGSFKSIAVSVGRFDSENVEIITGINEGDKIVSSAQFYLILNLVKRLILNACIRKLC